MKKRGINSILKNKNLIRSTKTFLIFSLILIFEIVFLSVAIDFKGLDLTNIYIFTELHFIFFLFIFIFAILSFKDLLKLKITPKVENKLTIMFIIINLVLLFIFYKFNLFIINNSQEVIKNAIFYVPLWYLNKIAIPISLLFAFFNFRFIGFFLKKFKKDIAVSVILSLIFHIIILFIEKLWIFFARITAFLVYIMLKIFFPTASYVINRGNVPTIAIPGFSATIYYPCSGIEGMGLFLLLFSVIVFIERKRINIKKVIALYPLGILGAFMINIIRTFSIFFMAHYTSPEFAIGAFHSNIGWILFTIYFLIFMYFSFAWMKR